VSFFVKINSVSFRSHAISARIKLQAILKAKRLTGDNIDHQDYCRVSSCPKAHHLVCLDAGLGLDSGSKKYRKVNEAVQHAKLKDSKKVEKKLEPLASIQKFRKGIVRNS
jgi:hypothetical protein